MLGLLATLSDIASVVHVPSSETYHPSSSSSSSSSGTSSRPAFSHPLPASGEDVHIDPPEEEVIDLDTQSQCFAQGEDPQLGSYEGEPVNPPSEFRF